MATETDFNCKVYTQIDKSTSVRGIYCFAKQHRPDMSLDEDCIAINLKFVTYSGLKHAYWQGYLYHLRYRFVFLVLIISEDKHEYFY